MEKKETGILFLSLSKLQLCLAGVEGTSLNLRVDVALDLANTSTGGDISWNNPNTKEPNKFSTGVKVVSKRTGPQMVSASELVESEVLADLPDIFHLDLERLSRRTNFFALNKENLTLLSNSSLKMTVVAVVPSLTAKVVKGQEPPTVSEPWVEISIPLSALVISHGFQMASSVHFEEVLPNVEMKLLKTGLIAKDSFLHWTLSGDNELCEFCLGCSLFRIESASVIPPIPSPWTIVIPDIADGKSKGPPNDAAKAAIRAKYIENVTKACANSSSLYSLKIGGQGDGASYLDYLASHTLSNALASFNSTAAAAVSVQEDIRLCTYLWSIAWSGSSQYTFLHRTELKRLAFALFIGPVNLPVSLNKKASPSLLDPKSKDKEPKGPVDISMNVAGQLSLSEFSTPGLRESTATVSLTTDTVDGADITLQMLMRFTSNPTPASVVGKSDPTLTVPDTLSSKRVVTPVQQVDPLQELRDEISAVVKYVAREYVTLYPLSPGDDATEDGFNLNTRKSDFFHFLSSTAKYHALKESLKPKIQRVVRYKYGVRGRALDPEIGVPAGGIPDRTDVPLDRLLQDMYVFLLKECNIVLNGLFASTLIEKDKREIETGARIDDEEETPAQAFQRLGDLSADAEADCRHTAAEQFHLERIQMSAYNPAIGIDNDKVYASYALYAEFLLRRAAKLRVLATTPESVSLANGYVQIAREALEQAVSRSGRRRYWRYELLLSCLLYDQGLEEAGDACMDRALSSQLGDVAVSISDLGGYDSDGMVKADPLLYAVLAGQYSRGLQPIKSRKALRLLSRSYAEGGFEPAVAHHGSPRRTATLCLARAAEYLFGFGFVELGKACLTLARECDRAATERALEFGVSPAAPVFIRYAIQRAEAAELLSERELDAAVRAMEESVLISEEDDDKVRSLLWVAGVNADYPLDDHAAAIDSYIRAIHTGEEKPYLIPLDALVRLGKLLIEGARYTEALEFLLFGCRLYAFSSTLFKLVGLTSLRLGKLEDAEDALYEANLLDNRSPEVWGYLCLLCLTCGAHREKEAELSLVQALRLGLDSNSLLRELAVAHMAADKLQVAEDLVRRATVCDRETAGRVLPTTRKLLADILVGQNHILTAVDEYRLVLSDPEVGVDVKLTVARKCQELLAVLGRTEEAEDVRGIVETLQTDFDCHAGAETTE